MDSSPTILRNLKLYIGVAGVTNTLFPKHIWLVRFVDADDYSTIWRNDKDHHEGQDGTNGEAFYKGLLTALPWLRPAVLDKTVSWIKEAVPDARAIQDELYAVRTMTIITPKGHELHRVFSQTVEDRQRNFYRKRDGRPWKHHEWIRRVDMEAAELKLIVTCREPQEDDEFEMLYSTQEAARSAWAELLHMAGSDFA